MLQMLSLHCRKAENYTSNVIGVENYCFGGNMTPRHTERAIWKPLCLATPHHYYIHLITMPLLKGNSYKMLTT